MGKRTIKTEIFGNMKRPKLSKVGHMTAFGVYCAGRVEFIDTYSDKRDAPMFSFLLTTQAAAMITSANAVARAKATQYMRGAL